jgi:hypothetical protein
MQANGPPDYAAVNALQKQYKLTPVSAWGEPWTPPAEVPVPPRGAGAALPLERVQKMDAGAFFGRLARLMKDNPPAPADAKMVKALKAVGIEAGKDFDIAAARPHTAKGLQRATGTFPDLAEGPRQAEDRERLDRDPGQFRRLRHRLQDPRGHRPDRARRNLAADVLYPTAFRGAHRYVLRFEAGQTPPANVTWSVSMYDPQGYCSSARLNAGEVPGAGEGITWRPGRRRRLYRIFVAGRGAPPPAAAVRRRPAVRGRRASGR